MARAPLSTIVEDPDGVSNHLYCWQARDRPRGVVQVLHGRAEHAGRYGRLAEALNAAGLTVYADDHRGHGRTGLGSGGLGAMGPGGQDAALVGVRAVACRVAAEHPGLPVVMLGHSWGSFIAQRYVARWGGELAGLVLTGTTDRDHRRAPQEGGLNAAFSDPRTPYDWLSRDEAEVDAYLADPWCGFEAVPDLGGDVVPSAAVIPPGDWSNIPSALPVLIMNGDADPVGGGEGGAALAARYRAAGLSDVELRVYPGARHELFNETNRDEVTADLLGWLDRVLSA